MAMRETTWEEIDLMVKHIHKFPPEYPQDFQDLPKAIQNHLRKTAFVFLTGDFSFETDMGKSLLSSTPPRDERKE